MADKNIDLEYQSNDNTPTRAVSVDMQKIDQGNWSKKDCVNWLKQQRFNVADISMIAKMAADYLVQKTKDPNAVQIHHVSSNSMPDWKGFDTYKYNKKYKGEPAANMLDAIFNARAFGILGNTQYGEAADRQMNAQHEKQKQDKQNLMTNMGAKPDISISNMTGVQAANTIMQAARRFDNEPNDSPNNATYEKFFDEWRTAALNKAMNNFAWGVDFLIAYKNMQPYWEDVSYLDRMLKQCQDGMTKRNVAQETRTIHTGGRENVR